MMDGKIREVYEALGYTVEEEGEKVTLHRTADSRIVPFDIKVRAYPLSYEWNEGVMTVTLGICLDPTFVIDLKEGLVEEIHWDERITIPVGQINIIKEED